MSTLKRSLRDMFRNPVRAITAILIMGMSIGVFLTMSVVSSSVAHGASSISQEVDGTITVRPAGTYGGFMLFGSSESINETFVDEISQMDNVRAVQLSVTQTIASTDASETWYGRGRSIRSMVTGIDPSQPIIMAGGDTITIVEGRTLGPSDINTFTAIVGSRYANTNDVFLGSYIVLNESYNVQVVGIYESTTRLGGSGIIMSYYSMKTIYGIEGPSIIYVIPENLGVRDALMESLRAELGDDYDITGLSNFRGDLLQASIDSIQASSSTGAWIGLITGAFVISFVMILVTRERIKEIGLLKALGFRNEKIMAQFLSESVLSSIFGFILGILIVIFMGSSIASFMIGSDANVQPDASSNPFGGGGGGGRGMWGGTSGTSPFSTNLLDDVDYALTPTLLFSAVGLAVIFGIIGSIYPVLKALKLSPSEALRYD